MIENTLTQLEARLNSAENLSPAKRDEILRLIATLRAEVAALSETHSEEAQSIARFAELSTQEATRRQPNPGLVKLSLAGLASSAQQFEQSHPRLVQLVNSISNTLSNLGI